MQKYILVGSSGYIGSAFEQHLTERDAKVGSISRDVLDYTKMSPDSDFDKYLRDCDNGNILINCAGYIGKPNVDACEKAKYDTLLGNVILPQYLANACREYGITFAHISSGCIYSDSLDRNMFTEEDKPNFSFDTGGSFYSGSKALAEDAVSRTNLQAYQFRLRIPFDEFNSPRNYLTKCLTYDKLIDVTNSISHRGDFVRSCVDILEGGGDPGIYNVVNPGSVTTKDVVSILTQHGHWPKTGEEFEFFENYNAFTSETVAARSNCTLSSEKLERCVSIRSAEDALHHACKRYS